MTSSTSSRWLLFALSNYSLLYGGVETQEWNKCWSAIDSEQVSIWKPFSWFRWLDDFVLNEIATSETGSLLGNVASLSMCRFFLFFGSFCATSTHEIWSDCSTSSSFNLFCVSFVNNYCIISYALFCFIYFYRQRTHRDRLLVVLCSKDSTHRGHNCENSSFIQGLAGEKMQQVAASPTV